MHDKGVLLHAHGRQPIDYISQAIFCASQIKKFLQLPVALVTSEKNISEKCFDHIINVEASNTKQKRKFVDNDDIKEVVWDNHSRVDSFALTPFKETIVMDTDYIVCNDNLSNCFKLDDDFMIWKDAFYLNPIGEPWNIRNGKRLFLF